MDQVIWNERDTKVERGLPDGTLVWLYWAHMPGREVQPGAWSRGDFRWHGYDESATGPSHYCLMTHRPSAPALMRRIAA